MVILSICLLCYDKILFLKSNVYDEIELMKYRENNTEETIENNENVENTDLVVEDVTVNEVSAPTPKQKSGIEKEFIGYLEIKKVNLKRGFVSKKSYYNKVDLNIQVLNESDYPDKVNGNVILASHSGTSYVSFFKNLYKLSLGDTAKIYYKGYIYNYKIVDIYYVPKVGKAVIKRDTDKSCLTLITCTKNDKKSQTIYILELTSSVKEGGNNA